MGCDIHSAIEIKRNGKWKFLERIDLRRNYGAFSILFGVRDYVDVPALFADRGLPKDSDPMTLFRHCKNLSDDQYDKMDKAGLYEMPAESSDSHSQSWMLASELSSDVMDKPIKFISIHKVGWREEAMKKYEEYKTMLWEGYEEALAQSPKDKDIPHPNEFLGTKKEWLARHNPLAIMTDSSLHIILRFSGSNIDPPLLSEAIKEGNFSEKHKINMQDVLTHARNHPEKYDVVESSVKTKDVYKWSNGREFNDWHKFIFKRLPELSKKYGAKNVRWVVWFDN